MKTKRLATQLGARLMGAFALAVLALPHAFADDQDLHASMHQEEKGKTPEQRRQYNALVKVVRDSTQRFRDVAAAEAEGYALQFGCVSGGEFGAMGLHFVKGDLVGDDVLDPTRPEIILYEPRGDGRVRLTGADFLVLKDAWDAKHSSPPQMMGQLFHLFEAPNRFGLPAFYTLHVWAWKDSPSGTFVNWNQNVSCDGFAGDPGNAK